jgi:hypothetical protein
MEQFYLLSVVANVIAGLALSSDYLGKRVSFIGGFKSLRENKSAEITLGVVTAIVGVLKLIIKSPGEDIPVAGDLLPGIVGVALGLLLLVEAFQQKVEASSESIAKAQQTVFNYRAPIGITGVAIALIHFFIPGILFL